MIERNLVALDSGMVRDTDEGKPDYTLVYWPIVTRWAVLMAHAAKTKGRDNWRKAHSEDDLVRFRQSAARHFVQWLNGEDDEDHLAGLLFNLGGAEYVKDQLSE